MKPPLHPVSWSRMEEAVAKVRKRLERAVAAVSGACVPYVVVGDHAVAAWVARVDPAAVRQSVDVELLVRRSDFRCVHRRLVAAGFPHRHAYGVDLFLDGRHGRTREGVRLLYAGEQARPEHPLRMPAVQPDPAPSPFPLPRLEDLLWMKLNSFRRKDCMHVLDLIEVGLVDRSWADRVALEHRERLETLLDDPDG